MLSFFVTPKWCPVDQYQKTVCTNARRKSPDKIGAPVYEEDERRQWRHLLGKAGNPQNDIML